MDILYLIDELESRLTEGLRIPFTSRVAVDEEACFDIINEMRSRIPEEVRQAQKITRERERILAQAHEEAERIIAIARDRSQEVLDEQEIVKAAGARAETIIERAQLEANRIKTEADDYVITVLSQLEAQLSSLLTTVRNGIKLVQEGKISPEDKKAEEQVEGTS